MKKVISILLILMMFTGVFADTAVPTLISVELPFGLEQEGDQFTIILDGNQTTGYEWTYVIKDSDHVKFIEEEYLVDSELVGAPGKHRFTFEVLADGVSTIDFTYARSFEEGGEETLPILVYKNGEKVFVEEDQVITIDDVVEAVPVAYYEEKAIDLDTAPQVIDGINMVPVAETLRAIGYTVTWNGDTNTVEISKGAQWTAIKIGENAYFKNRMAARPLSAAPVIVEGRTMVPAEFFYTILDIGMEVGPTAITFNNFEMGVYEGFVKEIQVNGDVTSYFVTFEENAEMVDIVLHTKADTTYFQKDVKVGDKISALTSMATTMSLPPQTAAYVIY